MGIVRSASNEVQLAYSALILLLFRFQVDEIELRRLLTLEYFLSRMQGRVSGQIIEASAINIQDVASTLDVVLSSINSRRAIKKTMPAGNRYSITGLHLKRIER